jgi:hypothetical protein
MAMATAAAAQPSLTSPNVPLSGRWRTREGFLTKRGHIFPTWRRRFVALDGAALA